MIFTSLKFLSTVYRCRDSSVLTSVDAKSLSRDIDHTYSTLQKVLSESSLIEISMFNSISLEGISR